jgi:K+-transporting ATPase ATPase A chain
MTFNGWLQIIVFFLLIVAVTKPLGVYMFRVFEGEKQPLPRTLGRIERGLLRLCGLGGQEQTWAVHGGDAGVQRDGARRDLPDPALAGLAAVEPQQLPGVPGPLAFNTAASFTTNTNWQSYSGETTMSYLTQMAGLAWHNFTSAAVGIGVALVVARGLTRRPGPDGARGVGNFYVDLIRGLVYVLLPACIIVALVLVSQGVIQNLSLHELTTSKAPSR